MRIKVLFLLLLFLTGCQGKEDPLPSPRTAQELLEEQLIDETHDAFLVDTGGRMGTLLVTVEKGTGRGEFEYAIQLFVWDPADMSQPMQTFESATTVFGSEMIIDVNFDGYLDVEVCGWLPNNSIPYYYWCWNPDSRRFEYAFCLQLTEVDLENRQLIAWYKVENGIYYKDYYAVTEGNQLELKDRRIEDDRPI